MPGAGCLFFPLYACFIPHDAEFSRFGSELAVESVPGVISGRFETGG